ncbi:MAG: PAS domain S-box protein [Thermomicrobiales bacterium]
MEKSTATGSVKRFIHRNGNTVWAEMNVAFAYSADNEPSYVVAQVQDVTEQHRLEEELRKSEAIFRSAFDNAAIGMARVGLGGQWLDVNQSLCRMLGYTREELMAMDFQGVTHSEDLDEDLELVERVLDGTIPSYTIEKRYFHKSGAVFWGELSVSLVRNDHGEPLFFISQIQDVNTKKQLEARLHHLALYDSLTGVLNRHGLTQKLNESIVSQDEPVAVLMFDMDGFKAVNDTSGHDAGDQVLRATAARIRGCLRSADIVARLGGDEFVVVLADVVSFDIADIVASRICESIEQPIVLQPGGEQACVSASVGIEIGRRADAGSDLIRRADQAMYEKKRQR